jgi:DNA-binding transcriptional LysR family regulator
MDHAHTEFNQIRQIFIDHAKLEEVLAYLRCSPPAHNIGPIKALTGNWLTTAHRETGFYIESDLRARGPSFGEEPVAAAERKLERAKIGTPQFPGVGQTLVRGRHFLRAADNLVDVVEEITPLLLEKLRAGGMDAALVALPLPVRSHEFEALPLLRETLYAVLPDRHPLARGSAVSLGDLSGEPFLLLRDSHCFRETAVAACKRAHLNPQIVFESGQFSSILSMVSAGLGVPVVPEMAVEKRPGCRFVPLADERTARTIGAISCGENPRRACRKRFSRIFARKLGPISAVQRRLTRFSAYRPGVFAVPAFTAAIHEFVRASSTSSGSAPPLSISS